MLNKPSCYLSAVVLALSACAVPQPPTIHPSIVPDALPASQGSSPTRELTVQELLSFQTTRRPGPGGRFWGHQEIGTYQAQRFVVEYICSDMCPDYTVTVYHFIDLRTPETCGAIGAQMRSTIVPHGIGTAARSFCMATPRMKMKAG